MALFFTRAFFLTIFLRPDSFLLLSPANCPAHEVGDSVVAEMPKFVPELAYPLHSGSTVFGNSTYEIHAEYSRACPFKKAFTAESARKQWIRAVKGSLQQSDI